MLHRKKYINEFEAGQTVECMSGLYKILKFNHNLIKGKLETTSATCISIFSGKETIISVNNNRSFTLYSK